MAKKTYTAYIDESGQRSRGGKSSPHFVMSALVVPDEKLSSASDFLMALKRDLRRQPGDVLHWKNYPAHADRLHASKSLASRADLFRVSSVVVCKEFLNPSPATFGHDAAYLYTFRFLLERLSWLVRAHDGELNYVLGHVVRFRTEQLREYEARLRAMGPNKCQIDWNFVTHKGGRIDQPSRVDMLQLADVVASAHGAAFNPDAYGNTESRYVETLAPLIYCPKGKAITAYGMKMHPWNADTKAAYPWVAAL